MPAIVCRDISHVMCIYIYMTSYLKGLKVKRSCLLCLYGYPPTIIECHVYHTIPDEYA